MESIIAAIVTAVITGGVTLCANLIANSKNQAILSTKLDLLSERVEKHNSVIERTFKLEAAVSELQHDIKRLESDGK